MNQTWCLCSLC